MTPNTAPELFCKAAKYLESQGFSHGDFSNYYPDGEGFENCGCIGLSSRPDILSIEVRDYDCANSSPSRIIITPGQEHMLKPILDVLIFAVRLGEAAT